MNTEEKAFAVLQMYGVPKERAKTVGNGIQVLVSRMDKEINYLHHERSSLQYDLEVLKEVVKEFFSYLDYTEESDSGKEFHPVYISNCRATLHDKVFACMERMKELSK